MGMALAYKKGKLPQASEKVKEVAKSMNKKQLRDFAETKRKGLPEKKAEEAFFNGFAKRAAEYGFSEADAVKLFKLAMDQVASSPSRGSLMAKSTVIDPFTANPLNLPPAGFKPVMANNPAAKGMSAKALDAYNTAEQLRQIHGQPSVPLTTGVASSYTPAQKAMAEQEKGMATRPR
jgi:hypothetical protein